MYASVEAGKQSYEFKVYSEDPLVAGPNTAKFKVTLNDTEGTVHFVNQKVEIEGLPVEEAEAEVVKNMNQEQIL